MTNEGFYAAFSPEQLNLSGLLASYDAIRAQKIAVIIKTHGLFLEAMALNLVNMAQTYIPAESFETYDFKFRDKEFIRSNLDREQLIGAMSLKAATQISLRYRYPGKKTDRPNAFYVHCVTATEQETDWACFEFESTEEENRLEGGLRIVNLPTELLRVIVPLKEAVESLTNFLRRDEDAVRINVQQGRQALCFETAAGTSWINIATSPRNTKFPSRNIEFKFPTKTLSDMLSAYLKICELARLSMYDEGLLVLAISEKTGIKSVFFLTARVDLFDD